MDRSSLRPRVSMPMKKLRLLRSTSSLRFTFALILGMFVQTPLMNAAVDSESYNPVAVPRAIVLAGSARFTVLTPQLIRLEWAADGKFEDHASFAFVNRRLPVPKFQATKSADAGGLTIKTDALELRYHPASGEDGRFTAANLEIGFTLNGKSVTWHHG